MGQHYCRGKQKTIGESRRTEGNERVDDADPETATPAWI